MRLNSPSGQGPLLALLGWLLASLTALAAAQTVPTEPSPTWPTVEQVMADTRGNDIDDTAARQRAALDELRVLVDDITQFKAAPAYRALYHRYAEGASQIEMAARTRLAVGPDSPYLHWLNRSARYRVPVLREALVKRYLSPQEQVAAARAAASHEASKLRRIDKQDADQQAQRTAQMSSLMTWGGIVALGLLVSATMTAALGARRLDAQDPWQIGRRGRHSRLHRITGTVRSPTGTPTASAMVTGGHVMITGNTVHQAPVRVHVQQGLDQRFFLHASDGREHDIAVSDLHLGLRDGHRLSAVFAIKAGKETGEYLAFWNHSTRQLVFDDRRLRRTLAAGGWVLGPMMALGAALSIALGVPFPSAVHLQIQGVVGAVVALAIWVGFVRVLGVLQMHQFKHEFKSRTLPQLDAAAAR